ncbi:MAG TPA: hypothetical protein VN450_04625 [Candidatus Methylomirabilis sp.]|nr:hypothetical protein [Candidatus Methylomirabilis sp.]
MIGTIVGSPEESARIDACDLDGDVEQGLEDRFGLKGCTENVTAFEESVDRAGQGSDLFGGNFEWEIDGAGGELCEVKRCHSIPR